MTTGPVPALVLSNLRRLAQNARKNRRKLDPDLVLAILNGKKA